MVVVAFVQGMTTSPFNDSLIRNSAETFSEVRQRAIAHIEAEKVMLRKNGNSWSKKPRHKENDRDCSSRSNEASTGKRRKLRYIPYVAKKDELVTKAMEETTIRPRFRVSCKKLLSMPRVADKLRFPQKTDRFLGSRRNAWYKFHRAFGHSVERCITLSYQLASLVKEGFLKEYLEANQKKPRGEAMTGDQAHETPIHEELNTIT